MNVCTWLAIDLPARPKCIKIIMDIAYHDYDSPLVIICHPIRFSLLSPGMAEGKAALLKITDK